jgi:hypothetical protein
MSHIYVERFRAQQAAANELQSPELLVKLTTTGKVQNTWQSMIVLNSTAARNCDMPSPTAAGVADKLWFIFNVSTATLTIRTDTGGTIIALTTVRRGALVAALGGAWKLLLKSAT